MKRLVALLTFSTLLFGLRAPAVHGCAGNASIPDSIFFGPLKQRTLSLPEPYFHREVRRLLGLPAPSINPGLRDYDWEADEEARRALGTPEQRRQLAEQQDLKQALSAQGLDDAATSASLAMYQERRLTLSRSNPAVFIPLEFVIYCEGAAAYAEEDYPRAVECWKALLALPAAERKYKSTWAAFMIGRALAETDSTQAIQAFEQCRALAAAGFVDSFGLAANSLGWQAREELAAGQPDLALRHYVEQARLPSVNGPDYNSLMAAASNLLKKADLLAPASKDPVCRPVITALLLSRAAYDDSYSWDPPAEIFPSSSWLAVVEQAGVDISVVESEDLAWLAYNQGSLEIARRWLARSPEHQPVGRWLLAKLMLYDGQIDAAVAELEALRVIFHDEPVWGIHGESVVQVESPYCSVSADLGAIYLGREQYAQAFAAIVASGRWEDIMYLAEHVLSPDEIESYLNAHAADPDLTSENIIRFSENTLEFDLRYLLARRLVREGRFEQARPHFERLDLKMGLYDSDWNRTGEISLLSVFDQLTAFQKQSEDQQLGTRQRATALFEAAQLTRKWGMELMGAEGDPDWHIAGGSYTSADPVEYRIHAHKLQYWDNYILENSIVRFSTPTLALEEALTVKPSERLRVLESEIFPDQRFHYRYLASDMMWRVALMLPRNDELAAQAIWYSARFGSRSDAIKRRGFKALSLRSNLLPAGQHAAEVGYLPEKEPLRNPLGVENLLLYVDARQGDDANDGLSWRQAKRTIDEAADVAADAIATGGSASIWVARGTYRERLLMRTGVSIHGGFAGNETELAQRVLDPLQPSRIDGSQARNGRPVYHVVEASAITTATLDGFTITGGSASGARNDANGGGIFCEKLDASVLIQNCIVSGNRADLRGAGIYCAAAAPRIVDCWLVGNRAEDGGGGIAFERTTSGTLTGCTIVDNAAAYGSGAGVYCEDSNPTFSACRIVGNWCGADSGGGLMLIDSSPRLENCLIAGNSAAERGGAAMLDDSFPTLQFCTIADNHAGREFGGFYLFGGWYDQERQSAMIITNSILARNDHVALNTSKISVTQSLFSATSDGILPNPAARDSKTTVTPVLVTVEEFQRVTGNSTGNLDGDPQFAMDQDPYAGKWSGAASYDRDTNTTRVTDNWAWFSGQIVPGDLIRPNDSGRTVALVLAVPDRRTLVLAGDLTRRSKAGSAYRLINYRPEFKSAASNQPLSEPISTSDLTGRPRKTNQGKGTLGAYAP